MTLGTKIRILRESKGMSQEDLAKAIGCNRSSVSRWESGKIKDLHFSAIQKLSKVLNISVNMFCDD